MFKSIYPATGNFILYGKVFYIVKPFKIVKSVYIKGRTKVGPRRTRIQRCVKFVRYEHLIPNGQIIEDKINGVYYINEHTANELQKAIEQGRNS